MLDSNLTMVDYATKIAIQYDRLNIVNVLCQNCNSKSALIHAITMKKPYYENYLVFMK